MRENQTCLYCTKKQVSFKINFGYGYVLVATIHMFVLDSANFNDFSGQMSQHLNCECSSLITIDTHIMVE